MTNLTNLLTNRRFPFLTRAPMRLTIPKRMLVGSSIIILMVLVVSIFSIITIYQLNQISEAVAFRNETIRSRAKKLQELVLSMEESEKKFIVLKEEEYRKVFADSAREFAATLNSLGALVNDPGVVDQIEKTRGLFATYRHFVGNAISEGGEKGVQKLESVAPFSENISDEIISTLDQALWINEENIDASLSQLEGKGAAAQRIALVICSLSILIGVLSYFYLSRTISRPVRLLEKATHHVSKGDFDHQVPIHSQDEVGSLARSFNEMATRLKELDELKSDFISLLSHELRTPLSIMREAVSLLRDEVLGKVGDKQREFLFILGQEVERMIQFVNELLDLSRIEAGRLPIEKIPVDIQEIIENNLKKIRPLLLDKKINTEVAMAPDLPLVVADGVRIDQVLTNLIDNAIKFTPDGGKIQIGAEVSNNRGRDDGKPARGAKGSETFVRVMVGDNGAGIEEEEKRYIFDKFYQAKAGKGRSTKGSGLGLSISKGIVEAHGGNIWFTSTTGEGTSFYFTLPVEGEEDARWTMER
jgi:signal transduction histidine kinase